MSGKVYLVGAGPGDPELLTMKAVRLLQSADVVLHDELIGPEVLKFVSRNARVRSVGKRCGRASITQSEINALLVNYALLDLQVVRLKGGDPLIFGRAGEEIEALRKAGTDFEIVPGITSALGGAASAQIPLTHRQSSSALILLTGHQAKNERPSDWPLNIPASATVVVYMPGYDYESTSQHLLASGVVSSTPCAIISSATTENQEIYRTTVAQLSQSPHLPAPTILVVGEVVKLSRPASPADEFSFEVWRSTGSAASIPFIMQGSQRSAGQEREE